MTSFLQSEAWQAFQEAAGTRTEWQDGLLYLRRAFGFGTYWQCSRFSAEALAVPPFAKGARFLRMEPEDQASLEALRKLAGQTGLPLERTISQQPRQTLVLDLERTMDEIVAGFKQKHRYNYGVSKRSLLEAEVFSKLLQDSAFDRFWSLMEATANRQEFRTHHKDYYREMLVTLQEKNMAHVIIVRRGDEDLAAMILITYQGVATYLHGASSSSHREAMAPYYLHVSAMQFAQGMGMKRYDFWGTDAQLVEGEWKPKEGAASYGTTRFKLGFGGEIVEYPGCYDLILQPFWYNLYKNARRLRGGKRAFA